MRFIWGLCMAWYSDNDRQSAAWLRALISAGLLEGVVDERGIEELRAADVVGDRCHFFAGIGGWELALRYAGWPIGRPVWTGSCPCQPYSSAGKGGGDDDPRNLWPQMFRLIRECRPATVFGEQVEGAVGHGWLDGVFAGLEDEGYACGAAVLGAHGAGAPHIRQRLFWVATLPDAKGAGREAFAGREAVHHQRSGEGGEGVGGRLLNGPVRSGAPGFWDRFDIIHYRDGKARRVEPGTFPLADGFPGRVGLVRGYGNAIVPQVAAVFIKAFLESEGG